MFLSEPDWYEAIKATLIGRAFLRWTGLGYHTHERIRLQPGNVNPLGSFLTRIEASVLVDLSVKKKPCGMMSCGGPILYRSKQTD
jgi:hypothetical protein